MDEYLLVGKWLIILESLRGKLYFQKGKSTSPQYLEMVGNQKSLHQAVLEVSLLNPPTLLLSGRYLASSPFLRDLGKAKVRTGQGLAYRVKPCLEHPHPEPDVPLPPTYRISWTFCLSFVFLSRFKKPLFF